MDVRTSLLAMAGPSWGGRFRISAGISLHECLGEACHAGLVPGCGGRYLFLLENVLPLGGCAALL